jgi:hypothetical protein
MYHTFHKPISGPILRDILNAGQAALAKNKATKWLSDDRNNAEVAPADIEFSVADWGPRAAQAGWKFWALVVPEDIAGRASMTAVVEAFYNLGVRVVVFTDLEEARGWLLKQ